MQIRKHQFKMGKLKGKKWIILSSFYWKWTAKLFRPFWQLRISVGSLKNWILLIKEYCSSGRKKHKIEGDAYVAYFLSCFLRLMIQVWLDIFFILSTRINSKIKYFCLEGVLDFSLDLAKLSLELIPFMNICARQLT